MTLPTLIILGSSGFAGITCYNVLHKYFRILLIDTKAYFEYSPSILDALCDGEGYYRSISFPMKHEFSGKKVNAEFICSAATEVDFLERQVLLANGETLTYDYLMICTGSSYNFEIKYTDGDISYTQRCKSVHQMQQQLKEAKTVWIEGAGGVGVEYSAAIWEKFNAANSNTQQNKQITLEYRSNVLPRCPPAAQKYVTSWMTQRNIRVIASSEVNAEEKDGADLLIRCHGSTPNTSFLANQNCLDEFGQILVNDHLQVEGVSNVFAIGDCIRLQGEEKKMCTARFQAKWTSNNLLRFMKGNSMKKYSPRPFKYNFSLGHNDGVGLSQKKLQFKGKITKISRILVRRRVLSLFSSLKGTAEK